MDAARSQGALHEAEGAYPEIRSAERQDKGSGSGSEGGYQYGIFPAGKEDTGAFRNHKKLWRGNSDLGFQLCVPEEGPDWICRAERLRQDDHDEDHHGAGTAGLRGSHHGIYGKDRLFFPGK